jgi:hypothetical protein
VWKWLVQLGLPLAAGAGLVVGLLLLSSRARDDLARRGEHVVAFTDIECDPPPGLTRQEFLQEAQYLAGLEDHFDLLDADTTALLERALSVHPWVARVRRVEQIPRDRVRALLDYRVPVLWVPHPGRAVDGEGVLLPVSAGRQGLAVLAGPVSSPASRPGEPWNDPAVRAAASVLALLQPHAAALALEGASVEVAGRAVALRTAQRQIIWGRPPGEEAPQEPDAQAKLARLLAAAPGDVDLSRGPAAD